MLQSHIHMCGMAILYFSALNLKIFSTRLNERCEFLVAIVAWVEIWAFLKDKATHLRHRHPVVVVSRVVYRMAKEFDDGIADFLFRRSGLFLVIGSLVVAICLSSLFLVVAKVLNIDKLVARYNKGSGRFLLAHANDKFTRLTQTSG